MPILEIKLTLPEGTKVEIAGLEDLASEEGNAGDEAIRHYFNEYLSNNGRKVFGAAARIEDFHGRPGFTLDDVAANLSVTYETVKSWHRTTGRSAKRWRRERGRTEPIRFEWIDYSPVDDAGAQRTIYRLPAHVVEVIRDLPVFQA
jgi:hypothetical protein